MTYNFSAIIQTPLSNIGFITCNDKLQAVQFVSQKPIAPKTTFDKCVARQLTQYFKRATLEFNLPLQLIGTPFQQRVWRALQQIKPGETATYGALAKRLKTSPRAIGNACRANPITLIVPCHRVVAKHHDGGYSGQTTGKLMEMKRWLLNYERRD
ncbi:MAG: methylated-DNA--[protein]-cysteine S-methyltransferase [Pseudomonadota bacterium]